MNRFLHPRALPLVAMLVMALASCGDGSAPAAGDRREESKETGSSHQDRGGGAEVADKDSKDGSKKDGAPVSTAEVMVVDTAFKPKSISVDAGSEVTWKQIGKQPHSITATDDLFDSSPDCSPIDVASCLEEGSEFSKSFAKPGTYRYYCRVHGLPDGTGMVGAVTVR